jgi:hypothetical protein
MDQEILAIIWTLLKVGGHRVKDVAQVYAFAGFTETSIHSWNSHHWKIKTGFRHHNRHRCILCKHIGVKFRLRMCRTCFNLSRQRGRPYGERHPMWKGGVTKHLARFTPEYKTWRASVFQRDNYTCQDCGIRGGRLQAHHIKSQHKFPELRLVLDNGLTLCHPCHTKTDNYGAKALKSESGVL